MCLFQVENEQREKLEHALSAVGSTHTQMALRILSMLNRGSMPRNLVALCHPGFLPPSPICSLIHSTDIF